MRCGMIQRILKKQDGSHLTQYLAVAFATVTLFTTGIHLGWLAPSLPILLSSEYHFEVSEEEASYIAIVSPIGHVAGGFISSYLNDVVGRKNTVLLTALPQIISFALIICSFYGTYFLYIARIVGGISEGACVGLIPCYIAEITEPSVRGRLGTMVAITAMTGFLFINILGSFVSIYQAAATCLIFPVIFLITFSQTPESPYYLLMHNRAEEAKSSLQILRRKSNVDKELLQLTADVNRQMSETGTFKDLFTIDSNRRALWIAVVTRTIQQWTGASAFASYYQILLAETTDLSPLLGTSCLKLIQILTSLACTFYIGHFGRKTVFTWSTLITSLSLGALAIHLTIRDYTMLDISNISWLPILYLVIFTIAFQAGLGAVVNVFLGEIFSNSIKSKALPLMSVVLASYLLITTKFFQLTSTLFGIAVPFWAFTIITFMGTWFFVFVLPETKDKSLETIQQELKGKKPIIDQVSRKQSHLNAC